MATLKKIYSDLDLTFSRQPLNGDVSLVYDSRSVINSVKNLLLTNFFERPFQPNLGSSLNNMLFEQVSPTMETTIQREILDVISNFEPRIRVDNIFVRSNIDNNGYEVTLRFFIGNNVETTQVSVFLERNR
jgi:phage baseplate assembly protein W